MGIAPGSLLKKPLRDVPFLEHVALHVGVHWWHGWWGAWVLEIRKRRASDVAEVQIVPLAEYLRSGNVTVEPAPPGIDVDRLWATALQLHAQRWVKYSLLNMGDGFNCESLSRLIQVGRKQSKQAETFWAGVVVTGITTLLLMAFSKERDSVA